MNVVHFIYPEFLHPIAGAKYATIKELGGKIVTGKRMAAKQWPWPVDDVLIMNDDADVSWNTNRALSEFMHGVDIMHFHYGWSACKPGLAVMRAYDLPAVVSFHGTDILKYASKGQKATRIAYEHVFRDMNAATCNLPEIRERAIELGCPEEKLFLVPSPVNFADLPEARDESHFTAHQGPWQIAVIGRLIDAKGVDNAIIGTRAANEMTGGGFELHIVGGGPEEAALKELAGGNGWIIFHGPQPHDKAMKILATCHGLLAPGRVGKDGTDSMGIGVSVKEAQCVGLPVCYSTNDPLDASYIADWLVGTFETRARLLPKFIHEIPSFRHMWSPETNAVNIRAIYDAVSR